MTTAPAAALEALAVSRRGMDGGTVQARLLDFDSGDGGATARAAVRWRTSTVPQFDYQIRLGAAEQDGEWRVRWRESTVHPALERATRLGTARIAARRGDILDRDGRPLVTERPVMHVAVEVDRVSDASAVAAAVAHVADVDAARLARAIRGAERDSRRGRRGGQPKQPRPCPAVAHAVVSRTRVSAVGRRGGDARWDRARAIGRSA
jgi:hypothetical protein